MGAMYVATADAEPPLEPHVTSEWLYLSIAPTHKRSDATPFDRVSAAKRRLLAREGERVSLAAHTG